MISLPVVIGEKYSQCNCTSPDGHHDIFHTGIHLPKSTGLPIYRSEALKIAGDLKLESHSHLYMDDKLAGMIDLWVE